MNRIQIEGFVGKDAETRTFENGGKVTRITVATSNDYFDRETNDWVKKDSTWHSVNAFAKLSDKIEGIKKGAKVFVEGKLEIRKWTDKEGVEKYSTEIRAAKIMQLVHMPTRNESPFPEPQKAEAIGLNDIVNEGYFSS